MGIYIGVDGKAREVKGAYLGVDGKARRIAKAYIGDENGRAKLVWAAMPPTELLIIARVLDASGANVTEKYSSGRPGIGNFFYSDGTRVIYQFYEEGSKNAVPTGGINLIAGNEITRVSITFFPLETSGLTPERVIYTDNGVEKEAVWSGGEVQISLTLAAETEKNRLIFVYRETA